MSKTEAAERIREIIEEIRELAQEAMDHIRENGSDLTRERARSYWYPHILMNLDEEHGYLGSSGCTMESSAQELEEEGEEDDEEEEYDEDEEHDSQSLGPDPAAY
jgi:methyl-accepting chemotaxis protein